MSTWTSPSGIAWELFPCATCSTKITMLEVFPGQICLDCYKQTPAAHAPLTASDITALWGGQA